MPAKAKKAGGAPTNPPRPQTTSNIAPNAPLPTSGNRQPEQKETRANPPASSHEATALPPKPQPGMAGDEANSAPTVNRKKQKRREKEAARRAAGQDLNNGYNPADHHGPNGHASYPHQSRGPAKGYFTEEADYLDPDFEDDAVEVDDAFYSGPEDPVYAHEHLAQNGYAHTGNQGPSGKKKKKNKKAGVAQAMSSNYASGVNAAMTKVSAALSRSHLPPHPPLSNAALRSAHKISNDRIWNTSTQAERENIKQFWLELGEDERRSLVKVEKEAVLRKMKEQQKHSCSCTVCGRKRTAIEEELEVLYDAYYEELEQFANHNNDMGNGLPAIAPPRVYDHIRSPPPMAGSYPSRGRVQEIIGDDDEDLDEEEEYDDEEEPYSDEEDLDLPRPPPDFFTFGNSLTVKDGILTVADDLLKNDGKHFIDMMEQLAERRMQREEELHYPSAALAHQNSHQGHNHPPLDEDDDYDEDEDDEDYDSQDDEDYEGDEMDTMTEEQRMEEGRRMFQIFAARMFEQRVLTAYREKVAQERQRKLIEELDEENRLDTQREAKKAKEAAKKKEKKKAQKEAKDAEKAKKDAEKAAQEAALREAEERKLEEQRQRKDEQRKKREAEKKASEEERAKKEAEKQRKLQEERDRQAEAERKQREAKEKEKKRREEARKKEREEREAKEREARERKLQDERERKARDDQIRKDKEAAQKSEREVKERARLEQTAKRPPIAVPPGLHPPSQSSSTHSPHFQVATPIIPPKAPTPGRLRQASQQGQHSHSSSPRSQQAATETSRSSASPASVAMPQTLLVANTPVRAQGQPPILHHPQPSAPLSPLNQQNRSGNSYGFNGMAGLGMSGVPTSGSSVMPGMIPPMPMYQGPPMGGPHRNFGPPSNVPFPPGIGPNRHFQQPQPPQFKSQAQLQPPMPIVQAQPPKGQSHSRQPSGSQTEAGVQPAPISRPTRTGRPPSATPESQKRSSTNIDVDNLATQLGSKALLEESDVALSASSEPLSAPGAGGVPGSGRAPFGGFNDASQDTFAASGQNWNAFSSNMVGPANWGVPGAAAKQSSAWSSSQPPTNAFGPIGGGLHSASRPHAPRPVAIRVMLAQACRYLTSAQGNMGDGFHPVLHVLRQVEQLKPSHEPSPSLDEMLAICDTEGNPQNGGGSFEVRTDSIRGQLVKFEPEQAFGSKSAVGDIGSPIIGHSQPTPFGGIGQGIGAPGARF